MKPGFITFTGADEHTSIRDMMDLAAEYPVEFGILFSPSRKGFGRYPPLEYIAEALSYRKNQFKLSAHLCGKYSAELVKGERTGLEQALNGFSRVQVNTSDPDVSPVRIRDWAAAIGGMRPILQCREDFPPG